MAKFSLSDITPTPAQHTTTDSMLCAAYLSSHELRVSGLHDLCGRLPLPGELMMLWTLKQFNAFTFIPYIIQYSGPIRELAFSTYSLSTKVIDSLVVLLDKGMIDRVHITISDSVKFRIPRVVDHLSSLMATRGEQISLLYGWNHSRVTLMRTDTGHYLVEGSGNFTENAQHEQYIFLNSVELWHFRKQCIHGLSG
jgi:hypothetical protein